jgi:serine/threonine-protein kinase
MQPDTRAIIPPRRDSSPGIPSALPESMRELAAGDHLDRFLLTDVIARTGMATVFKGHDTAQGAPVCLKVPLLERESDLVFHERFEREERIAQRLDHQSIVRALPASDKSRMYMVLEYVDGRPLRSLLQAGPLPRAQALSIARQLLGALVYLHEQGIVHRDIKPENVLVLPDGRIKLLDFGIALDRAARRLTWSKLSGTIGTPDYMAPEQLAGRRGDERSDVYAAGVVVYEMLTGGLPYPEAGAPWLQRFKVAQEPRPLTWYVSDLDPALGVVVEKAVARVPRDRFPSAAALLAALERPELPIVPAAGRPRRPFPARVVAAVVLAALAGLTWVSARAPAPDRVPVRAAAPAQP